MAMAHVLCQTIWLEILNWTGGDIILTGSLDFDACLRTLRDN